MGCEDTGSIEVTMNGLIKTGEKRGRSTIIIAEEDPSKSFEDKTIVINVLIANIFSIFIENSDKVTFYHIFQYTLIYSSKFPLQT
jgi:hypothetical protein